MLHAFNNNYGCQYVMSNSTILYYHFLELGFGDTRIHTVNDSISIKLFYFKLFFIF